MRKKPTGRNSAQMATVSSFTTATNNGYQLQSGITITRNKKDDYSITGVPDNTQSVCSEQIQQQANYESVRLR